jgi:hypothetical protein
VAAVKRALGDCFELLRLLLPSLRFASCFECFEGPIGPEARSKTAKRKGLRPAAIRAHRLRMSDGSLHSTELQRSGPGSGGVTGKGFQPGQTGNPGGRAKPGSLDIAALARSKAPKAIAALERALDDPKHYVAAAIALLDRGFGRPAQAITATDNTQSITFQHLVAARAFSDELARERAAAENAPTISGRAEPRLSTGLLSGIAPGRPGGRPCRPIRR